MTVQRLTLSSLPEQQTLSSDLVIPNSYKNPGPVGDVIQHAIVQSVEAKVEARLSVILEGIGDAFYALDGDWRFAYINRAAQEYFGAPAQDMLGRVIWDVFPNSEGTELRRRYEEVAATGTAVMFETEAVGVQGRFLELRVFPYNGGLGVSFRDWTERRRTEEELRESQARLSALADNLPSCMVFQFLDSPKYEDRRPVYISKACEKLTGIRAEDALANMGLIAQLILPEYREQMHARGMKAHKERQTFDTELKLRHAKTGEIRWHRMISMPRRLSNGTYIWDGVQYDITDHKRAEEHLRLMVNELNHRVKNTLATVQSLAVQSFHKFGIAASGDIGAARTSFEARLFALSRAHDVLTRENWEGANLSDVVREACGPFRMHNMDDEKRIVVQGEELRLPPAMSLSLSMAIHELCTNALKYGALTTPSGSVRISWSRISDGSCARLAFRWEEHGGPAVTPPRRTGFGSRLIQRGLARELNGVAHISYEPEGVVCTIDVPLETNAH
ncbi:sensor histidine kinase [Microvirga guangxiensis]|uniref:Blue-light-activated histidine kinase n=1 Tax=Microvirga guangxiensis TaxID=549386 RepID=A0A1G5C4L0_9HYPH|nr:HWE histidine kinase domain-containing protein [Microvirga guangxiensis]SCX97385.1 PAS domain S-box-containing protein [Microvirga guangxiensis]